MESSRMNSMLMLALQTAETGEWFESEYFTPIVPGRIDYPSRLYFPVDPPVR